MEEQSIGSEIKKIDNLIIRKIMSYSKNNSYMLSPSQMMITRFLYKNSGKVVCQKDLEGALPFRKSTISGIIQTMMKNNIISTESSKDDLRSKRIILTPYGKKINKEIEKNIIEFEKVLKNNIKEDDLRIFFKVTKQIQNNLKGENDD